MKDNSIRENPLIGIMPADTLSNASALLSVLMRVNNYDGMSEEAVFGMQLLLCTIKNSIDYEEQKLEEG